MATATSKEVREFRSQTLPGETQDAALLRKVKMHEFLMTGGVQVGYNQFGKMQYSDPITVAEYPLCPWHDEDCPAWEEIVAGRGHWTRLEAELAEAEQEIQPLYEASTRGEATTEEVTLLSERIIELHEALSLRPRDVVALRERTPEQIEAEKREARRKRAKRYADLEEVATKAKSAIYAKAGPKTGGNPWDKPSSTYVPTPAKPKDDSRNDAVAAFAGEAVPDVIEVEGDEGEEGDE